MGQDIPADRFTDADFAEFHRLLRAETAVARKWARQGKFADQPLRVGCELECCLADGAFLAAPRAETFLKKFNNPDAEHELAEFNVEFNAPPFSLSGAPFAQMRSQLNNTLNRAESVANKIGLHVVAVGVLPTLTPADFSLAMMTNKPRYRALLSRVAEVSKRSIAVRIPEGESLAVSIESILLEAATTSFQIHLQVPGGISAAAYNAAQALTAPIVALGANSPFFFGRKLWMETRIPVFEQALFQRFGGKKMSDQRRMDSFFGVKYARRSPTEMFSRNLRRHPILLPFVQRDGLEKLPHLALHNGTIWRWNRPVVGFEKNGQPSLRIEHRTLPSGPTVADCAANAAIFVGATFSLAEEFSARSPESVLPFETLRRNFYIAARDGIGAKFTWLDGKKVTARELILRDLLPRAKKALTRLGVERDDIAEHLGIARDRAKSGRNGATWQTEFIAKHGGGASGMSAMTRRYWELQRRGAPAHLWKI